MLLDIDQEELSSANARQDKIDLEIGDWHLIGDEVDMEMFCNALHEECVALAWHRVPTRRSAPPYRWFNAPQGIRWQNRKIRFRASTGRQTPINRPLVSGFIEIKRAPASQSREGSQFIARATLSINPTRFVTHLRDRINVPSNPDEWEWGASDRNLLSSIRYIPNDEEYALDGRDNVLFGPAALMAGASPLWQEHVNYYFRLILALLNRSMVTAQRSPRISSLTYRHFTYFNLRAVETYWEFHADSALSWVNRAHSILRALGTAFTSRAFPSGQSFEHVDGHALSHSFKLTDAIACSVYAKTDNRIRVEVKHDLSDATVLGGQHTAGNFAWFFPWLNTIADDAGVRALPVVRAIRQSIAPIRGQLTALDLMTKIARAADSEITAQALAVTLFNIGMIDLNTRPQWTDTVSALVNDGVLERARIRRRQYRVTALYAVALQQLVAIMRGAGMSELGIAPRFRRSPPASR